MKKFFSVLGIIGALGLSAVPAFADSYVRDPAAASFPPQTVSFSYELDALPLDLQSYQLIIPAAPDYVFGDCHLITDPGTIIEDDMIPMTATTTVQAVAVQMSNEVDCSTNDRYMQLEYTGDTIFTVEYAAAPQPGAWFAAGSGAATGTLATVSAAFQDPGTLTVLGLAAGIPLAFYVLGRVVGLLSQRRGTKGRRRDY